jgi:hypothetical protein
VTGDPVAGSPLTLLGTSSGFDQSLFSVALGSRPDAQILRLLFGQTQTVHADGSVTFDTQVDANGSPIGLFGPGAQLDFSLSVDADLMKSMRLELPEAAAGIVLQSWPTTDVTGGQGNNLGTTGTSGSTPNTATQVPEPWSFAIWGLVLTGAMGRRRMRRLAS